MRKDTCFDEQLKKELIKTLNFMLGLIPVLNAENESSNVMARMEKFIETKTEDLSALERSKTLIKEKEVKKTITSSINEIKKIIEEAKEEKNKSTNRFFESVGKISLYRSYASAKWEYFKKLNFTFTTTEIENLTDEMLIGYFLFEGMGASRRNYTISCSKDNKERLAFIKAYEESWNSFLEWIYTNITT